jgi:hypothetical protein
MKPSTDHLKASVPTTQIQRLAKIEKESFSDYPSFPLSQQSSPPAIPSEASCALAAIKDRNVGMSGSASFGSVRKS